MPFSLVDASDGGHMLVLSGRFVLGPPGAPLLIRIDGQGRTLSQASPGEGVQDEVVGFVSVGDGFGVLTVRLVEDGQGRFDLLWTRTDVVGGVMGSAIVEAGLPEESVFPDRPTAVMTSGGVVAVASGAETGWTMRFMDVSGAVCDR